jgi:meiosis-specific protein HOP1
MFRLPISSVNLSVTSIASFLPSSTGQDEVFAGLTPYTGARPTLSPIQEATFCKQQADKQREDAETRNVVWSGENSLELDDLDGECEDDPDYVRLPDGRYEKIDAMSPIGIRSKDGNIKAIAYTVPEQPSEAQFGGFSENVPIRLQDIVCFFFPLKWFFSDYSYAGKTKGRISETQAFEETQTLLLTPKNLGMYPPTFLHENYIHTYQLSRRCRHLLEIT